MCRHPPPPKMPTQAAPLLRSPDDLREPQRLCQLHWAVGRTGSDCLLATNTVLTEVLLGGGGGGGVLTHVHLLCLLDALS